MRRLVAGVALAVAAVLTVGPVASATDFKQDALKMILKQNTASGKEKVVWVSKAPAIVLPASDPTAVGATLRVEGADQDVTVPLPAGAANWRTNAAGTLYKFVNKLAPGGPSPCKVGIIKQAAVFKVVCKDSLIDLNDTTQGTVAMTLTVDSDRYCSTCATPIADEPGKFIGRPCPAPTTCGLAPTTTTTTTSTTTTSTTTITIPGCCDKTRFSFTTGVGSGNCGSALQGDGSLSQVLTCGGLYFGGGGVAYPLPDPMPDQGQTLTSVASCNGVTGAQTLGPLTTAQTGSNRNCSTVGCLFGPPLPILNSNSVPTSICMVNVAAANASGTGNCLPGTSTISLPLTSNLYMTGDLLGDMAGGSSGCVGGANNGMACTQHSDCPGGYCGSGIQACPLCTGGTVGVPGSGTCRGGPNNGLACAPEDSEITLSYPTSHDCQPPTANLVAALPVTLNLTTGTQSDTDPGGLICGFCRAGINNQFGVCTGGFRTGLACIQTGTGPTQCPGICVGGSNPGVSCVANPGVCAGGGMCNLTAVCAGPAIPCSSNADCVGVSAGRSTCSQRTIGAFGDSTARTITETGTPAGALTDGGPHAATLVSLFCMPPTFYGFPDNGMDLPGPGAVSLQGSAQLLP